MAKADGEDWNNDVSIKTSRKMYLAAIALFTLALLSKPTVIVLPAIFLLLDWSQGISIKISLRALC